MLPATLCFMHLLVLSLSTALILPEYKIKVKLVKKFSISMGEFDVDDLEMIAVSHDDEVKTKMRRFHQHMNNHAVTEMQPQFVQVIKRSSSTEGEDGSRAYEDPSNRAEWEELQSDQEQGIEKRADTSTNATNTAEDYDILKMEYQEQINKTSTTARPQQGGLDVTHIVNCTTAWGIGLNKIKCIIQDIQTSTNKTRPLLKLGRVLGIWFCMYLVLTIALWCRTGLGCCCFQFAFCYPKKRIAQVQRYIALYPPGLQLNPAGEEVSYRPSHNEKKLYFDIKKTMMTI